MRGLRWALLAALVLSLGAAASRADWRSYYEEGLQLFQAGDYARAAGAFLQARRTAPQPDPALHAWLGRAYYKQGRYREAIMELELARQLQPDDGGVHLWLGYAYVRDRRPIAAVGRLREAARLSPEAAVRESAERWLKGLHEPSELVGREPPDQTATAHFLIKHYPSDLGVQTLAEQLEDVHAYMRTHLGLQEGRQTEVLVFRDMEEYRQYHRLRGTPRPDWSLACSANGRIFTYQRPLHELGTTVAHEYTHVAVQLAAAERTPPCWFDEGLAAYVAGEHTGMLLWLRQAYAAGQLLGAGELQLESFGGLPAERALLAYAQARAMTEWFLARFGKQGLLQMLAGLAENRTADEAFAAACRLDQEGLLQLWLKEVILGGA